eukprot:TRINITY_DN2847_c0_g1_i1.p1 TRINITY_DN2847_c0_g1~~TRINITY_DN2847_c0_g1_i1.p1  ORF type:complete len:510 (+),score=48.67 TRINITY_DN2847_c0_g1_i1:163-1530(+)
MYEAVDFYGWFGLALAVQRQPVIVNIQSNANSFVHYRIFSNTSSSVVVYNDPGCYTGMVDHSVVVVGYFLTTNNTYNSPYWIIRNSWGTGWGDKGYMKMAIVGGTGICGIHTTPGFYPIIPASTPCGGRINPCGSGTCRLNPATGKNKCTCPTLFESATNIDGSQTCALSSPCTFFLFNPCIVGTCLDDPSSSGYFCICPRGFGLQSLPDGRQTCGQVPLTGGVQYYVSQPADTCYLIYTTFGLTQQQFSDQNGNIPCKGPLSRNSVIVVTPRNTTVTCHIRVAVSAVDTCTSIAARFNLSAAQFLQLNPSLNCPSPLPGQQVCITKGGQQPWTLCAKQHTVTSTDNCASIVRQYGLTLAVFFTLNPGIICQNLLPRSGVVGTPGQQVCIQAAKQIDASRCRASGNSIYRVTPGSFCASIIYSAYKRNSTLFSTLNGGFICDNSRLYVGLPLCAP